MTHRYSEDSDQAGHPRPSLKSRNLGSLATHLAHSKDSDQSDWVDTQPIWTFAGCTGDFVGLVTVWLLFSFNTYKILFLWFQRHVQLFRINREEVMIMKKQWQWRGKHDAKKIKRCDQHYFWIQHYWFSRAARSVTLKWAQFRAFYKWLLTRYSDLFCQWTISVFC